MREGGEDEEVEKESVFDTQSSILSSAYLTLASIAYFMPLGSSRVYEGAFGLNYTGVNVASIYLGLTVVIVIMSILIVNCNKLNLRITGFILTVLVLLSQIVMAISCYVLPNE